MIIKASRLQAWVPAEGGGGSKSRPSPPPLKMGKNFGAILVAFLLLFLHMGAFLLRFSHFGFFFTMWGPFRYFLFHGGGFFWACPPPLQKFLLAPMIARRVREHNMLSGNFLCDRNLVSSGHVCYDFALKMTKIMINCSHVVIHARWV